MKLYSSKRFIISALALVLVAVSLFLYFRGTNTNEEPMEDLGSTAPKYEVIGKSVEGRDIEAYTFGNGESNLLFIGGIHGGYEWNSVVLAFQMMDYLEANTEIIPENLSVTIIPNANPDGVFKVVGKEGRFSVADVPKNVALGLGRFNSRNVDLNRNFDCKWQPESTWRNNIVSAGSAAFSEPEAKAIRDFVNKMKPDAVVFWHSQSGSVYASECENGILPETLGIMNTYAKASGYKALNTFDSYKITGDSGDWLASIGVPAITVELTTHETIEWEKNLSGVKALLLLYTK